MSIDIQPHLIWFLPALITIALGIISIMPLFGGNKMPVEGKVRPSHTNLNNKSTQLTT